MAPQTVRSQSLENRASTITTQLRQFHDLLRRDAALAKLVPFSVQVRNQRDKNRFAKLLSYPGPDQETLNIFNMEKYRWYHDPSSFTVRSSIAPISTNDPFVHLASRFLQLRHDDS